jgi:hypothetical protein
VDGIVAIRFRGIEQSEPERQIRRAGLLAEPASNTILDPEFGIRNPFGQPRGGY